MEQQPAWKIWIILWGILVIQTTVVARFTPGDVHFDLGLLAVVSVALLLGSETGATFGLVTGVLTGFCAGVSLGSFAISRLIIGASFGLFDRRFSRDNPLAPPLCAAVATIGANVIFALLSPIEYSFGWWLQHTIAATVVHAILIWPVYWIFSKAIPAQRAYV